MPKMSRRRPLQTSGVVKTLWPPQPGTVELARQHGDALLCVRYRSDASGLLRYTTVELVVATRYLRSRRLETMEFDVQVAPHEQRLRSRLRALGAKWMPESGIWRVDGATIRRLNLAERVRPRSNV